MKGLVRKATSQHGLLSTRQLRDLGVSKSVQAGLTASGLLEPMRRGVVALAGAPDSWHQRMMALQLAAASRVGASHRSALRIWGFWERFEGLEVSVHFPEHVQIEGVIVHRTSRLEPVDVTIVDGLVVTTLARTLVDVGAVLPGRLVGRLIDHAIATRRVSLADVAEVRRRIGDRGRDGLVRIDTALSRLMPTGAESGPELEVARLLVARGLPQPLPQHEVRLSGGRYRIDLAYPDVKLAIEYDGLAVHSRPGQFEADRYRQNDLVEAGWTVLRFTARDLREGREDLVNRVRRQLRLGGASGTPLAS